MILIISINKANNVPETYALHSGVYYNEKGFSESTKQCNETLSYINAKYENPNVIKINKVQNNTKNIILDKKENTVTNKQTYKKIDIGVTNKQNNMQYYKPNNDMLNLSGWVRFVNGRVIPRNFGDDINFSFLLEITGYKHTLYNSSWNDKNFLMIGSIFIDKYIDSKTEVWGSGMLRYQLLKNKPYKIHAVRGPKTREIVLASGIDCPEVYGDPALLLPYYYYPYIQKKYKLGIIPHHSHIRDKVVNKFNNIENVKVINFTSYNDWKDVIKEIIQCEFIVSESLHGLIISEAYKIPNVWISFGDIKQDIKYEDFFLSVGKKPYNAFTVTDTTTVKELLLLYNTYDNTFNLNISTLVNVCPVKLQNINMCNKPKKYTGKVLLCCIGKMENLYIREFVEYYKNLGFDNICLYDNNDKNGERFEDVIGDYIKTGFVILKDLRGVQNAQIPSYTDCYKTYKDQYDWIAFFDIDEFLDIDNNHNIKQFLSNDKFNDRGINCIRLCWKQFTDSGIVKVDNNYSVKRFKDFIPLSSRSVSALSKCIIKTVKDNVIFSSPHGALTDKDIIAVNSAGELCNNEILMLNKTWEYARLNHYRFKTIEEYVLNKMVRLWPTKYLNGGKTGLNLEFFFKYNKLTEEKKLYAEFLLNKYNISRNEK